MTSRACQLGPTCHGHSRPYSLLGFQQESPGGKRLFSCGLSDPCLRFSSHQRLSIGGVVPALRAALFLMADVDWPGISANCLLFFFPACSAFKCSSTSIRAGTARVISFTLACLAGRRCCLQVAATLHAWTDGRACATILCCFFLVTGYFLPSWPRIRQKEEEKPA